MAEALPMPTNLVETMTGAGREPRAWLRRLPEAVAAVVDAWDLTLGDPFEPGGTSAWVAPACTRGGAELVLKVAWRHDEAAHEADGLRVWDGDGAVRVHAVDEDGDTVALLIERCVPGTTLASWPEPEQDVVVAGLLRRLWREPPAGQPFRPLQLMCDTWADAFEQKMSTGAVDIDPGLAREAAMLLRTLPGTAPRHVLLCTDLHAGNVLAAEREPWLVIDPKPYVGDPTYDPVQHLLNCRRRLQADPVALAQRLADLVDVDADRLVLWLFARCVQQSPAWPDLIDVARTIGGRPSG